jgi:hypothetical protein
MVNGQNWSPKKEILEWHIRRQVEVQEMVETPNRNVLVLSGIQASQLLQAVSSSGKEGVRFTQEKMLV